MKRSKTFKAFKTYLSDFNLTRVSITNALLTIPQLVFVHQPLSQLAITSTTMGWKAGEDLTTGSQNTFVGSKAGMDCNEGDENTCLGWAAGVSITTGYRIASLVLKLEKHVTCFNNAALGVGAGRG